eukprot:Phypoly_transcript_14534.p1 GENE.Phypoly_transcript_14534~~Phypoly_transcript_14534.p1  ORF type:complete len:201 (+),score=27.20 Phypoly_transcript_14534:134-736(+)
MGNTPGHSKDVSVSVKQMQDRGVKSGFLTKVGQSVKSWKRRYFIFDGDTLYYFENVTSLRQKGEIRSEDILRVARADVEVEKPFSLIVETPHRSYYVVANSEQDIEEWRMVLSGDLYKMIDAIEELCKQLNTELIGTNDDQLEHRIGELQDLITDSRNALYSCAKGKTCANKADQLITQSISALQQRRRVFYGTVTPATT